MDAVVEKLQVSLSDKPHVALLNNLGAASVLEMGLLANELMQSSIGPQIKRMVGPASMMTSLDMHGFSVSLMELGEGDAELLSEPTPVSGWPGCVKLEETRVLPLPDGLAPIKAMPSPHEPTRAFLISCCELLISAEADLNALDAKSGDGDTGSTLANASRALIGSMGFPAACRSHAIVPGDRAGTEPDYGWLFRRVAGDLLCRRR